MVGRIYFQDGDNELIDCTTNLTTQESGATESVFPRTMASNPGGGSQLGLHYRRRSDSR